VNEKKMTEPERLVRRFLELAIVQRNMDEAIKLFHEDAIVYEPPGLPYGGTYLGPKAMQKLSTTLRSHLSELSAWWIDMPSDSPESGVVANDKYAILYGAMKGKSALTGKTFLVPVEERYRVRDGKFDEVWVFYHDTSVVSDACRIAAGQTADARPL
tara:strand:- start:59899 stop:60369 length:471 start_codon:yes stop_codon:yes gene_type:complete